MNDLILWVQLGLPVRAPDEAAYPVRRIKGAFSRNGKDEGSQNNRKRQPKTNDTHRSESTNKADPPLCKRCEKNPRGDAKGPAKTSYCRNCRTELMRGYRARAKRMAL